MNISWFDRSSSIQGQTLVFDVWTQRTVNFHPSLLGRVDYGIEVGKITRLSDTKALFSDVELPINARGFGIGQKLHNERLLFAKHHFEHLICFVEQDNAVERHILEKFGWYTEGSMYEGLSTSQLLYRKSL